MEVCLAKVLNKSSSHVPVLVIAYFPWIANGVIGPNGARVTSAKMDNDGAPEISKRLPSTMESRAKVKQVTQPKGAALTNYAKILLVAGAIGMIGARARVRAREEGRRAGGL